MSQHATFSPSASSRWLICHGSVEASEGIPETFVSDAATYGTECHEAAAAILEGGVKFNVATDAMPDEQADLVGMYTDFIYGLADDLEREHGHVETWIETRFHSNEHRLYFGTADFVAWVPGKLIVVDLKTGWVPVKLRRRNDRINPQLGSYALLAADSLGRKFDEIELWVVQPRVHLQPLKITISKDELIEFSREIDRSIKAIEGGDKSRHAGEHCKYCRVSGNCKTQREFAIESAKMDFMNPDQDETFTDADISNVLSEVEALEIFIAAVRQQAHFRMAKGHTIPDWKLVERRPTAKWIDPEAVKAMVVPQLPDEDVYRRTLRTPKQISEALVKAGSWDTVDHLFEKKSSGATIARVSDKRNAVVIKPGDDFND